MQSVDNYNYRLYAPVTIMQCIEQLYCSADITRFLAGNACNFLLLHTEKYIVPSARIYILKNNTSPSKLKIVNIKIPLNLRGHLFIRHNQTLTNNRTMLVRLDKNQEGIRFDNCQDFFSESDIYSEKWMVTAWIRESQRLRPVNQWPVLPSVSPFTSRPIASDKREVSPLKRYDNPHYANSCLLTQAISSLL